MSFLKEIQNRKEKLKITETVITHSDGTTYVENTEMRFLGLDPIKNKYSKNYGFVVDLKPDNVPANIVPGLYIGSQDCMEEEIIRKYRFTHILSIGVDSLCVHLKKKFIPCLDLPETRIDETLNEACAYIRNALHDNGSVLIHCNAGVSRSAMVVIGYLILECQYSFDKAYNLVKCQRPSIQPNLGFIKQLKKLENVSKNQTN